jgi:chromosome segregation ATPase
MIEVKEKEEIELSKVCEPQEELVCRLNAEIFRYMLNIADSKTESTKEKLHMQRQEILSNLKAQIPGVIGRVIEFIRPREDKFALVIQRLLGNRLYAIVVDSVATAKKCSNFVTERSFSPEIFIPETVYASPPDHRHKNMEDFNEWVVFACDLIEILRPNLVKVVSHLTDNALVCETRQAAGNLFDRLMVKRDVLAVDGYDSNIFDSSNSQYGLYLHYRTHYMKDGRINFGKTVAVTVFKEQDLTTLQEKFNTEMKKWLNIKTKQFKVRDNICSLKTACVTSATRALCDEKQVKKYELDQASFKLELEHIEEEIGRLKASIERMDEETVDMREQINGIEKQIFQGKQKKLIKWQLVHSLSNLIFRFLYQKQNQRHLNI